LGIPWASLGIPWASSNRPQIDLKSTANRPQIDLKSTYFFLTEIGRKYFHDGNHLKTNKIGKIGKRLERFVLTKRLGGIKNISRLRNKQPTTQNDT
jgi:hypothetical protein